MSEESFAIEVYYNSACPVCKAGITEQQGRMRECAVAWNDIHGDANARRELPVELEAARKRLHVRDGAGRWQVGIDAFIEIWRRSPHEGWKARLLSLPLVRPVAGKLYNAFAHALYLWNRRKGHW